jgi:hypothetical protein
LCGRGRRRGDRARAHCLPAPSSFPLHQLCVFASAILLALATLLARSRSPRAGALLAPALLAWAGALAAAGATRAAAPPPLPAEAMLFPDAVAAAMADAKEAGR